MNNTLETLLNQEHGAANTTARYSPVKTATLLEALAERGYTLAHHSIAGTRSENREGFQKHLLRLRHVDLKDGNGTVPEIIIINSHDGTAATRIMAGVFRFACANGLIAGNTFQEYRVRHVGPSMLRCLDAVANVAASMPALASSIERLESIKLSPNKIWAAEREVQAVLLKGKIGATPMCGTLTKRRRQADLSLDAFTVLNVLQENALKGGMEYTIHDDKGVLQFKKTRVIKSIDVKTAVNKAVWDAIEKVAA